RRDHRWQARGRDLAAQRAAVMTAKLPPGSPNLSPRYDPEWAILLWRLIGYRQPLIDRLRDRTVDKTSTELEFIADVLDGTFPPHRGTEISVERNRNRLGRVATFLEFRIARRFLWEKALEETASQWGVTKETVLNDNKWAEKELGGGEWYRAAHRLAHKAAPARRKSSHSGRRIRASSIFFFSRCFAFSCCFSAAWNSLSHFV